MSAASHRTLPDGRRVHVAGWHRDGHDLRDFKIAAPSPLAAAALARQHLLMRPHFATDLGVYDQGELGSCTANGSLAAFRWLWWKAADALQDPDERIRAKAAIPNFSRLAQYAWSRDLQGTPLSEDSGCSIRDAIKTLHTVGAGPESIWPYDPTLFDLEPPADCKADAARHESSSYHSVAGLPGLKAEVGRWYPVTFGFEVPPDMMSEETARTGVIPLPSGTSDGGHCMLAVGYCDDRQAVQCLNSWGEGWGDSGFCWLPYRYFTTGLASDLWVIHTAAGVR